MFDPQKLDGLPPSLSEPEVLRKMPLEDLLQLHSRITAMLPATSLAELNLEKEVVLQYLQTKALLSRVLEDKATPANQRAQVANSCESILGRLMKMQQSLYGTERVKAMEASLLKVLKTLPNDAQEQFLSDYERIYREHTNAQSQQG